MNQKTTDKMKWLEEVEKHLDERCVNLSYPDQKRLTELVRTEINTLCAGLHDNHVGSNPDLSH
jgi:hypothetical protein